MPIPEFGRITEDLSAAGASNMSTGRVKRCRMLKETIRRWEAAIPITMVAELALPTFGLSLSMRQRLTRLLTCFDAPAPPERSSVIRRTRVWHGSLHVFSRSDRLVPGHCLVRRDDEDTMRLEETHGQEGRCRRLVSIG